MHRNQFLTLTLKTVLALVGMSVLDHLVVTGTEFSSFVERAVS